MKNHIIPILLISLIVWIITSEQAQTKSSVLDLRGTLEVWQSDVFQPGAQTPGSSARGEQSYYLNTNNEQQPLSLIPEDRTLASGPVTLRAKRDGDRLVAEASSVQPDNESPTPRDSVADTTGQQDTLVILASIGDQPAPTTLEEAQQTFFGDQVGTVSNYYQQVSYGQISFVGHVTSVALPANTCSYHQIQTAALAAVAPNENLSQFDRIIITSPTTSCAPYGGVSSVGKINLNVAGQNIRASVSLILGNFLPAIVAHEVGHGLGLQHANYYTCLNRQNNKVPFSYDCESQEYYDRSDLMGETSLFHLNASYKAKLGWLASSNIRTVTEGVFSLIPAEPPPTADQIQLLKLPLKTETSFYEGVNNRYYTLEYRAPLNYDANLPTDNLGVQIRLIEERPGYSRQSNVLDMKPGDVYAGNVPLLPGQVFLDPLNQYQIKVLQVSPAGATAEIKPLTASGNITEINPLTGDTITQSILKKLPFRAPTSLDKPVVALEFSTSPTLDSAGFQRDPVAQGTANLGTDGTLNFTNGLRLKLGALGSELAQNNQAFTIATKILVNQFPSDPSQWLPIYGAGNYAILEINKANGVHAQIPGIPSSIHLLANPRQRNSDQLQPGQTQNRWLKIALVFKQGQATLYLDGQPVAEQSTNTSYQNPLITSSYVGYTAFSPTSLNGKMDYFRIWARALSAKEVAALE